MMKQKKMLLAMLAVSLSFDAGVTIAAEKGNVQAQQQEQIYGSQLMTQQERMEYRSSMRSAKTLEERERIRNEHHEKMKVRAQERGVTLPDQPPAGGAGMGPGAGGGWGTGGGGRGMGPRR